MNLLRDAAFDAMYDLKQFVVQANEHLAHCDRRHMRTISAIDWIYGLGDAKKGGAKTGE